jgi:hypothetical protein
LRGGSGPRRASIPTSTINPVHSSSNGRSIAAWLAIAAVVVGSIAVSSSTALAGIPSYKSFTCAATSTNECVVTIHLTSHLHERVGSTMPDTRPWSLHSSASVAGKGGYTLSGPGEPATYWNGKAGGSQGTVWSALLTTGKVASGAAAILTFSHVESRYRAFSYSYSSKVFTDTIVIVTATVTPRPAKGHLFVQQLVAQKWGSVGAGCTYAEATKNWSCRFKWVLPKHQSRRFRLLATAAPGLLATASSSFLISTAS